MAADDLSAPLGQDLPPKRGKRWSLPVAPSTLVVGVLGLVVAVFAAWAIVVSDPMGGEPSAVVALGPSASPKTDVAKSEAAPKPDAPGAAASAKGSSAPAEAQNQGVITIIDGSTGKKQEIPVGGEGKASAGDQRLSETTRHGPIPKIAPDGTRPADAYARQIGTTTASSNAPRIAIVVSGLGIGAKLTADATAKLPGPVTFSFTPYGADVPRAVAKAREAGHEVLLQVPMEPVDYPDNDPGPQTLLTSLTAEQNIDRLYWLMSRFTGYVGISNYMGSRFTAAEAAVTPMLKETAKRGLIYFDDGSATRSLVSQLAGANNIPFAKADVVLDAVPTQGEMAKAFTKLEATARMNGTAIGIVGALPISIERVVQWAKTAESLGFVLVPITVAAMRNKQS